MYGENVASSSLLQSTIAKEAKEAETYTRIIRYVSGDASITPNFGHKHSKLTYIAPTGNLLGVSIGTPLEAQDTSLHYILLDNSNNIGNKVFTFSSDYVLLDDPTNTSRQYTIAAGKKIAWFCTWLRGKMYMRLSSESTN